MADGIAPTGTDEVRADGSINWPHLLVEQLDWHWRAHLRPRLDGLTDHEYLWEPAQPAWNIHPSPDGGPATIDFAYPEPTPPPVTTIAWRMAHVAIGCLGGRASAHFGDGSVSYETAIWPPTAAEGLQLLDDSYADWRRTFGQLDDEGLAVLCAEKEPYPDSPRATLVLHINRETIHHGAELCLLRDLYRAAHR